MFGFGSRRILGPQVDSYSLSLGFRLHSDAKLPIYSIGHLLDDGTRLASASVSWKADEEEKAVLERLAGTQADPDLFQEHVRVRLRLVSPDKPGGIVSASAPTGGVAVSLTVRSIPPSLRSLEVRRGASGGGVAPHLLALLAECTLEDVQRLKCAEGLQPIWEDALFSRWQSLSTLILNNCGLTALPTMVGRLTNVRELHVSHNKLVALPHELGSLARLSVLKADDNLLTSLPVELRACTELRVLSLENNRLQAPVIDLRSARGLRSLQLFGNPLELLPELSPCSSLRHMSLANARISVDDDFETWTVEVVATGSYLSRAHTLAPLCALIFKSQAPQHPLLAGALAQLAEDEGNCAYIESLEGAIQQIVLMGLSDDDVTVEQACKVIGLLGRHSPATAAAIVASDVARTIQGLLASHRHRSQVSARAAVFAAQCHAGHIRLHQVSGLRELARLALCTDPVASQLLTPDLLTQLLECARHGAHDVQGLALEALGNLGFCSGNRDVLRAEPRLRPLLARFSSRESAVPQRVRHAAIRALAILGENEEVRRAVNRPPIAGRGVRILAMDGGGMKGLATLRMLWQLQERTGRRIHELFDLICGTSTGGILAAALLRRVPLAECEEIYRVLGAKVFSRPLAARVDESWRDSLMRVYKSGQQSVRVAVYGCKHDAAMFEVILKEYCKFDPELGLLGDLVIDTACLDIPKFFVVSTLATLTPAQPFILRNYEHSAAGQAAAEQLGACPLGASNWALWQAVRASSAAPYYLDDFHLNDERYQDGAATANNPAALALAEARALWPDTPVDVLISLGSGERPPVKRERSLSTYLETGSVLIESATDTERVAGALATLAPLIPGLRYFRFNPLDERCSMELDSIEPDKWLQLEAATDAYIAAHDAKFDDAARALCSRLASGTTFDTSQERLGLRREVLVLHAFRPAGGAGSASHVDAVARWLWASPHATHSQAAGPGPAVPPQRQLSVQPPADIGAAQPEASSEPAHNVAGDGSPGSAAPAPDERKEQQHHAAPPQTTPAETAPAAAVPAGRDTGFTDPAAAFADAARRHADRVGVVHLALHARGGGLVTAWRQQVQAVAEPGVAADTLLAEAGGQCGTVEQLFSSGTAIEIGGDVVMLLGRQQQFVAGAAVSSYLLLRTQPAAVLTAAQVTAMAGAWEGQVVVTTAPLPHDLTAALLTAGTRAVISRRPAAPGPSPAAAVAFCSVLYDQLLSGRTILQALKKADQACSDLAGAFECAFSGSIIDLTGE